jgi:hypothetical protein
MTPLITRGLVLGYRAVLLAYPPAFRLTFGDSMAADFSDALHDVGRTRTLQTVTLLIRVACDLLWSIACQWLRTSVPWLTAAYAAAILAVLEWLASAFGGPKFGWSVWAACVPLVSIVTFTIWFLLPHMRQQRDKPPCLKSAN